MIKAAGSLEGRPLLVLGLSRRNCELLLEGRPIKVDLEEVGRPEQGVVLIVGGETETHPG